MRVDPHTPLRRSHAVVVTFEAGGAFAFDFLARSGVPLSPLGFDLLAALADWVPAAAMAEGAPPWVPPGAVAAELDALWAAGLLVAAGTPEAEHDQRYAAAWPWGPTVGVYHFGMKDPRWQSAGEVLADLAELVATGPQVPLWTEHAGLPALALPPPRIDGAIATMARRRSQRGFDPDATLPAQALADCLFAGFGIVGFMATSVPGEQPLPLSMAPSGGARNPYEAYVYARAVAGLEPGVYHYAGISHTLALVTPAPLPPIGGLLAGQDWFDAAAAVVFLVAHFERSGWKYPHPTGHRVVLVEAGHRAQNLLLAATELGLAAAPTCALADGAVERLLGLDPLTQGALHAVALGVRGARAAADPDLTWPNERPGYPGL